MLLPIAKVLTEAQVARCRELMERASWMDGRITAGHQSAKAKDNLQIPEGSPEAREMGAMIGKALEQIPLFVSAALPTKIFPPLFNRYEPGITFGAHVDNAIRPIPGLPSACALLVSAGATMLVWTGLSLAWRHLFGWNARRSAARRARQGKGGAPVKGTERSID
jgi:PKHD-type hydroxylase